MRYFLDGESPSIKLLLTLRVFLLLSVFLGQVNLFLEFLSFFLSLETCPMFVVFANFSKVRHDIIEKVYCSICYHGIRVIFFLQRLAHHPI